MKNNKSFLLSIALLSIGSLTFGESVEEKTKIEQPYMTWEEGQEKGIILFNNREAIETLANFYTLSHIDRRLAGNRPALYGSVEEFEREKWRYAESGLTLKDWAKEIIEPLRANGLLNSAIRGEQTLLARIVERPHKYLVRNQPDLQSNIAQALIDAGADKRFKDKDGNSLMHTVSNHVIAETLLQNGLNITDLNDAERTPLSEYDSRSEGYKGKDKKELIQWFLSRGASAKECATDYCQGIAQTFLKANQK